ncbi:MAG: hypothetical protein NTV79_09775 [Candidatus Aureabacteria bacterium]|nr:hypothetical protein [Candidatus Auribacterota bacterium]
MSFGAMAGGDRDRRGGILPDLRGALLRAPEALCPQERTVRDEGTLTFEIQNPKFQIQSNIKIQNSKIKAGQKEARLKRSHPYPDDMLLILAKRDQTAGRDVLNFAF